MMLCLLCFSYLMLSTCCTVRATRQEHMQTYCPPYPLHREPHMLLTTHTTITTTITITAAIYLFVCYLQLWYSPPRCAVCSYAVVCDTSLKLSVLLLCVVIFSFYVKMVSVL